jgi:hypothetical protein
VEYELQCEHRNRRMLFFLGRTMSEPDVDDVEVDWIVFSASDEELERAAGPCDAGVPTLIGTYCFTCKQTV